MSSPTLEAYVALKTEQPQVIPAQAWTMLRFPEPALTDRQGWHQPGNSNLAGLITPTLTGIGHLAAMVQWEPLPDVNGQPHKPVQIGMQFARDPLNQFAGLDTTATHDRMNTTGGDYDLVVWFIDLDPSEPLAVRVYSTVTRRVMLAEFKIYLPFGRQPAPGG